MKLFLRAGGGGPALTGRAIGPDAASLHHYVKKKTLLQIII